MPDPRARHVRVRDRRLDLRRTRPPARLGRVRAALGLRGRRPRVGGLRDPRDRLPDLGLLVLGRRVALVDDDAVLLPRGGVVVLAGGLAPAVAVAALDVVEPRAVPDAPAPARRRAV